MGLFKLLPVAAELLGQKWTSNSQHVGSWVNKKEGGNKSSRKGSWDGSKSQKLPTSHKWK